MKTSLIPIDSLRLSQIYLSQKKLDDILTWFDGSLDNFQPIYARDFLGNGNLHITDGHTRTYAAWQYGVEKIPYVYDEDEIVTCEIGRIQYKEDIVWCDRFSLHHISALKDRILPDPAYDELWRGRCSKMHNLKAALLEGKLCATEVERKKDKLRQEGLYVYGISDDFTTLYAETPNGQLSCFSYSSV
jgi:hypothetical protein